MTELAQTKVVHSKEAFRRFRDGEWMGHKLPPNYVINDIVPEQGEFPDTYPPYVDFMARTKMLEAARSLMVTAKRRGITIDYLQLSRDGIKMGWRGEDSVDVP